MKSTKMFSAIALTALLTGVAGTSLADNVQGAGDADSNWRAHIQSQKSRAEVVNKGHSHSADVATYHEGQGSTGANANRGQMQQGEMGSAQSANYGGMNVPSRTPSAMQSSDIGGPFHWGG